jgi:hypothetical protein
MEPGWFAVRKDVGELERRFPHAVAASVKATNILAVDSSFHVKASKLKLAKSLAKRTAPIFHAHYPRVRLTVASALMHDVDLRNAVNYVLAKHGVRCYLHTVRTRKGGTRIPVLHATWFHDGEWFMEKPVSDLDEIITTGIRVIVPKST